MRKILFLLTLLASVPFAANAQQQAQTEQRLVSVPRPFFVPHWYIKAQGGAAYDVGEAKFSQLLSPGLQLGMGYRFSEYFGLRGTLSGMWSQNRYSYPEAKYKWNFIQPSLDAEVDLTQLILGRDPERLSSLYAFVGIGAAYAFNNDDAVDANAAYLTKRYYTMYTYSPHTEPFQYLWNDSRWNLVARAGIGYDYRIAEEISIGAELNANMLPDHFNSKMGKHDNKDWHFNAMVGIKFNIGHSHGRTEPVYEEVTVVPPPPAQEFVDVPAEQISFNVNIYFIINQSIIRANQMGKLNRLLDYLAQHPKAFVRLSGYADKETGNPTINMRLSIERSQAVSQYLTDAGVAEWRIRRFAKGDRVQPFDIPEENRVCICYVYDPDNPTPQRFDY